VLVKLKCWLLRQNVFNTPNWERTKIEELLDAKNWTNNELTWLIYKDCFVQTFNHIDKSIYSIPQSLAFLHRSRLYFVVSSWRSFVVWGDMRRHSRVSCHHGWFLTLVWCLKAPCPKYCLALNGQLEAWVMRFYEKINTTVAETACMRVQRSAQSSADCFSLSLLGSSTHKPKPSITMSTNHIEPAIWLPKVSYEKKTFLLPWDSADMILVFSWQQLPFQ